jgi:calcium permeable stress-gated cation channel
MASLQDLGVSAFINILGALVFLVLFAVLRIQPVNDRVYFPKLYLAGKRAPAHDDSRSAVRRFVNLNLCTYLRFLGWVPGALRMTENELIAHAGLDSAVYLRIYTLGSVARFLSLPSSILIFVLKSNGAPVPLFSTVYFS